MAILPVIAVSLLLLLHPALAAANRLQVSPVTIDLDPARNSEALWLTNTSGHPLTAQIRLYRWRQDQQGEHLEPTNAVAVSPAQATIPAGQRQLVRILRRGHAPATEQAYRLIVDEIITDAAAPPRVSSLQFRLRYSLPVFDAARDPQARGKPELRMQLHRSDDLQRSAPLGANAQLFVANSGLGRAQLSEVVLVLENGMRQNIADGLLGYVLAGSAMRWPVTLTGFPDITEVVQIQLRLNGETQTRRFPVRIGR